MNLDPGDRAVAKKAAREAAAEDLLYVDEYIKENPTLIGGYPADPVSAAFEALYADQYDDDFGLDELPYDDDSHLAVWDDDPSPYDGTYSED